jgi:serine/threonine protein kinase
MNVNMDSKIDWDKSDFIFKRQLGVGQFGIVYEAMEKNSCFPVAIKIIPKNKVTSEVLYKRLKREIEVHSRLKFDHICRLFGYFTDANHIYLVLEYCRNGNLYMPGNLWLMQLK